MNKIFEITMPIRPPTKKNNQSIYRRRNGTPFIASNKKTKAAQNMISAMCRAKFGNIKPLDCPICFFTVAVFKIPKSGINKLAKEGDPCMLTPDASNIDSMLNDALEGIIYRDDKQITEIITRKIWGKENEVRIKIYKG